MGFIQFLRSRLFWKHLLLSFSALILFFALIVFLFNLYTQHDYYTKVPNFKGIYINNLSDAMDDYDISYSIIDSIYSSDFPKGTVVDQNPAAGSTVKNGRTVYLTVNAFLNQQVLMPNLINLSLRQATSLLETYGLKIGKLTYVDGLPPIIEQWYDGKKVAPNTPIYKGSSIDLVLGKDKKRIKVPNLVGISIAEAKEILEMKNFTIQIMDSDSSLSDTSSVIIQRQEPSVDSDMRIDEGDIIRVWIKKEEEEVLEKSQSGEDIEKEEENFPEK